MEQQQSNPRRIEILRGDVAKKIAAGEVIDRPFSVLRELLDNAIDAGANLIEVRLEAGGTSLIQVRDNGRGMDRRDLELCWQSHATSKIRHEDDLLSVRTLGFRGEALASIASVSRLEIVSATAEENGGASVNQGGGAGACRMNIEGGGQPRYEMISADDGTRVSVRDLFYNLPARKKFIKSPGAETRLCRNALLEKAAAHPGIEFRFFVDGKARDLLPAAGDSLLQRIAELYPAQLPRQLLKEVKGSGEGFRFSAIIGLPPLHRSDRKFIHIHCNSRRINEFSLVHAVEYAMGDLLPGGTYPLAFVFFEVDPAEVDFNIHPAKREARFSRPDAMHRALREAIQHAIRDLVEADPKPFEDPTGKLDLGSSQAGPVEQAAPDQRRVAAFDYHSQFETLSGNLDSASEAANVSEYRDSADPASQQDYVSGSGRQSANPPEDGGFQAAVPPYRYLGQIFSLFLLMETRDGLYIIDQHAAHERILFEQYRAARPREDLLIPMLIENEDPLLAGRAEEIASELGEIGFKARADEKGNLEILAVPGALHGREQLLPALLRDLGFSAKDLENRLYENMACRTAVKDGDVLDAATARMIIEKSWQLPVKRCPHGRPIWFSLSRRELFQLLGREI
jgi:DNA mismatch repair protein MutL